MTVSIRSIETAVPPTAMRQSDIRDLFAGQPNITRLGRRLIGAVFDASAIETRYTVIDELAATAVADPDRAAVFYDAGEKAIVSSATGARNDVYVERSRPLFVAAAEQAVQAAPGIEAADITHVITVSCTGFFAPGPDHLVVRALGLRPTTQRFHLGFMGCYGAFPALRAASSFCRSEPDAVVLIVCAELCTLHLRSSNDSDTIVASSVFADGAAAAVVSARPVPAGTPVLEVDAMETVLTPNGETDMAWKIGDAGFEMVLSSYVPRIIEEHISSALAPLLAADPALSGQPYGDIDRWAIHPGGRSILDRVQHALALSDEQLAPSRDVLRRYGNMSSATVLFILRTLLHDAASPPTQRIAASPSTQRIAASPSTQRIAAMAFGPGLTVESALLTRRVAE